MTSICLLSYLQNVTFLNVLCQSHIPFAIHLGSQSTSAPANTTVAAKHMADYFIRKTFLFDLGTMTWLDSWLVLLNILSNNNYCLENMSTLMQ